MKIIWLACVWTIGNTFALSVKELDVAVDRMLEAQQRSMALSIKVCDVEFSKSCTPSGNTNEDFGCLVVKVKKENLRPACRQQLVETSRVIRPSGR